jgi:hypothetical protein
VNELAVANAKVDASTTELALTQSKAKKQADKFKKVSALFSEQMLAFGSDVMTSNNNLALVLKSEAAAGA